MQNVFGVVVFLLSLTSTLAMSDQPKEITDLYAATFTARNTLSLSYATGGCKPGKPTYKLELVDLKVQNNTPTFSEVFAKVRIHIFDGATGLCLMLMTKWTSLHF